MRNELTWNCDTGVGYFPCDEFIKEQGLADPYNKDYFDKYHGYANTEMGRKILDFRLNLVNKYTSGTVIDVGIGSGQFVEARNAMGFTTLGTDANPAGIAWLKERDLEYTWSDSVPVVTFFDSLEHIKDFTPLLEKITKFVFVSIPIFTDYKSVLSSRHYRKTEHYHYFNHFGFVSMMWNLGFRLCEQSDKESDLGRSNVRTYVFKRT